jgi:hypothetical protein
LFVLVCGYVSFKQRQLIKLLNIVQLLESTVRVSVRVVGVATGFVGVGMGFVGVAVASLGVGMGVMGVAVASLGVAMLAGLSWCV